MKRAAVVAVAVVLLLALLPHNAWAWSPGTHIFLGQSVLANLQFLPGYLAELLQAHPFDFLYGSIAADTSFAKKYAPVGRHSHAWHVGQEIVELSGQGNLRSFGFGYLAHLAADVVAHNFFVPRQLVLTSSTRALGHSYWEGRFDMHIGDGAARTAREILAGDHAAADEHLDRIISPTIFSVGTSRRLFHGMVQLTDWTNWRRVVQMAADASRWDLPERDVERHVATSFDYVMDLFNAGDGAQAHRFDPSGARALAEAKRMRRLAMSNGGRKDPERVLEVAEAHFGLKPTNLGYWERYDVVPPWRRAGAA
ncbi:MAG TPA: zinc dependent phospholipase C family protein [Gemmatimonadales bacterium]|nr:zinc dependent phospholipase C family protein [Gemmatimonadales bacterium]